MREWTWLPLCRCHVKNLSPEETLVVSFLEVCVFSNQGIVSSVSLSLSYRRKSAWFMHDSGTAVCVCVCVCVCLSVCLSVCVSQVDVLSKPLNKSNCFVAWQLPFTYPTVCYKKIEVTAKIRVSLLSSWTISQTSDLENFASAYRSSKLVINLVRVMWTVFPYTGFLRFHFSHQWTIELSTLSPPWKKLLNFYLIHSLPTPQTSRKLTQLHWVILPIGRRQMAMETLLLSKVDN